MGEATQPLAPVTDTAALIAVTEEAIAEIRAVRELLLSDLGERPDPVPFVMLERRLADLADIIRKATRYELTRDILQPPTLAAVPQPRHRHRKGTSRQRAPGEGQLGLFRVPSLVLVTFAALKRLAPHAGHGTVTKAISLKAALLAAAVPATGVLVVGAVVITHAGAGSGAGSYGGSAGPNPAASAYAATPAPSSSLIARTVTRPKAKRSKEGKTLLYAAQPPYSYPAPEPSATSASASASAPASAVAGNAALAQLTFTSLDLSNPLDPQVTFTLTATGTAGWVSWRIDTTGTDLDFSTPDGSGTHGVLNAGQSVVVTVSVDAAQALDGNTSQVFTVNGNQSVTVSLPPLLVSTPAPVVSASDVPSVLPSL